MEELDLKELIIMFLEKKLLIVLVVIISGLLGAIYTLKIITPMYSSSTTLVLVQTGENDDPNKTESITTTDITLNSKLVNNYSVIAKSKSVVQEVMKNLKIEYLDLESLQKSISVSAKLDTEVIEITVIDKDPELACKITNELAKVFINKVIDFYRVNNVNVLDVAEVDYTPYNIHLVKNVVISSFVGLVLILGYIILTNMLDTTVKTDTDIEKFLNVPVLASIMLTDEDSKKKSSSKGKKKSSDYNYSSHYAKFSDIDKIKSSSKPREGEIITNSQTGKRGKIV